MNKALLLATNPALYFATFYPGRKLLRYEKLVGSTGSRGYRFYSE